jgi:hypothetical protein
VVVVVEGWPHGTEPHMLRERDCPLSRICAFFASNRSKIDCCRLLRFLTRSSTLASCPIEPTTCHMVPQTPSCKLQRETCSWTCRHVGSSA